MIERIKSFLRSLEDDGAKDCCRSADDRQIAVAALMLEAALMDQSFDDEERGVIKRLLAERFQLADKDTDELLEIAQGRVEGSLQLYGFTSVVKDNFTPEERIELMEMLWQVAYADGKLDDYEANLMRRVSGLIFVSDWDSGQARKRALARLGLDEPA
ncbi:MAG: TerB family tellurite resistance protein [Pseudomonadota bacterium]